MLYIKFLFGDILMKTQTTSMIVCNKGLPFEIKIPNDETLQAMEEARKLDGDFVTLEEFKK